MRTLAMIGAVSITALFAAGGASAWTQEQTAQGSPNGTAVDLSDPDNFQALQDKVNGKTQSQGSFQIYGGTGSVSGGLTGGNPYGIAPMGGRGSAFSYSPTPGFRGNAE